jgi:hypothetical protein
VRRASLILVILVAAAHADAPKPPKLAAHYAPLFEKGRTWVYDTSLTTWADSDGKKKHTDRGVVTCTVVDVATRVGAMFSHVTCDKDDNRKFRVAGYYAATGAGMWSFRSDDLPTDEDLTRWMKEPPAIAAKPKVSRRVRKMGGPDPKHDDIIEGIRATSGGWCVYEDSGNADVDGGKTSVCYVAGIGIANAEDDVGGELNDFAYIARRTK